MSHHFLLLLIGAWFSAFALMHAESFNGFDIFNASVPASEIVSGGPPRDGIPSIDTPKFIPAPEAEFVCDEDIVIGLTRGNVARAYPLRILVWHEIVNDTIGGDAVAVTYCPLCGTSMVFDRKIGGTIRNFGVSGLLYNSNVLLYDRETESLWSQLSMEAVSGPSVGAKLAWLPSEHLAWKEWRTKHPDVEVLSPDTGHDRDYGAEAYASYFDTDNTMFPVRHTRTELRNKTWVLGVNISGHAKAYPVENLPDGKPVRDCVSGQDIEILWNKASRHPIVRDADGKEIPSVMLFWFAWQAFHPDTELYQP
jgi:Protein of unknown function (DUF3179)